jgi:hypothetical protein
VKDSTKGRHARRRKLGLSRSIPVVRRDAPSAGHCAADILLLAEHMAPSTEYMQAKDLELYASLLREIKARMAVAEQLLAATPRSQPNCDLIALELRVVLELLVLGSLITNRNELTAVRAALHKTDASAARKLAKRMNPGYWPKPSRQVADGPKKWKLDPITEGYLTEDEWGPAYGYLSDILHATNPFKQTPYLGRPLEPVYERASEIVRRLVVLLDHHTVELVDREYILIAMMQTKETGDVAVTLFQRQA